LFEAPISTDSAAEALPRKPARTSTFRRLASRWIWLASSIGRESGEPSLLLLPRCDSDGARARSDGKPRCADIVPVHRMRRVRPSRTLLGAKATKIDGFRDASPGRPAATQQR
jgi:hypothetical protein